MHPFRPSHSPFLTSSPQWDTILGFAQVQLDRISPQTAAGEGCQEPVDKFLLSDPGGRFQTHFIQCPRVSWGSEQITLETRACVGSFFSPGHLHYLLSPPKSTSHRLCFQGNSEQVRYRKMHSIKLVNVSISMLHILKEDLKQAKWKVLTLPQYNSIRESVIIVFNHFHCTNKSTSLG